MCIECVVVKFWVIKYCIVTKVTENLTIGSFERGTQNDFWNPCLTLGYITLEWQIDFSKVWKLSLKFR